MFNFVSDVTSSDEHIQFALEKYASVKLSKTFQKNLVFFKHFDVDLYKKITEIRSRKYSVFCANDEEINIFESSSSRVLYPKGYSNKISCEVSDFCSAAPHISLRNKSNPQFLHAIPSGATILVFGIASGLHLEPLIEFSKPKVLVIYEPEFDLFLTSLQFIDWSDIYFTAEKFNTTISLQVENNGTSISADLNELLQIFPNLNDVYLYRHLTHAITDEILCYLFNNNSEPEKLLNIKQQFLGYTDDLLFIPEKVKDSLCNKSYSVLKQNALFNSNLEAFSTFYPDIFNIINSFKPVHWVAVDDDGKFNLWCQKRYALFYQDEALQTQQIVERFLNKPIDNSIVLNQGGVDKFQTYIHYQAVLKLQSILKNFKPRTFSDLSKIENLVILGIGLGRHIEQLLEQCSVKNLLIFEPNLDFFYGSLFVTDWKKLFEKATELKHTIYFNLGGTGDEYFHDIMGQYYNNGVYGIANTQFFPAFLTPGMSNSLSKLQSQLRVIMAMGENFDYVRYGISHTLKSVCNKHYFLKNEPDIKVLSKIQSIPVFIIGNGPSLDDSYKFIIEHRDNVLVISCGTALRSLYKLGITPDFHAEIEQNRAPYDFIIQVDDIKWLKSINLISINGIHPDVADLFNNVFLAFKDGDSSTNFFRSELNLIDYKIKSLSDAYPTVSNLVVNFFSVLGFKQIYLFGVDLGYVDFSNHHSKHSAYYNKNGQGILDAAKAFGSVIHVKGNFRHLVQTKFEFDFSRRVMEKNILNHSASTSFYNCSDGAFINGALPLKPENLLIYNQKELKEQFLGLFKTLFYGELLSEFAYVFNKKIDKSDVVRFANGLIELSNPVDSTEAAKALIERQWKYLIDSECLLSFYLFCGSVSYMLSVLTRVLPSTDSRSDLADELSEFNEVLEIWRQYIQDASESFITSPTKSCDVDIGYLF